VVLEVVAMDLQPLLLVQELLILEVVAVVDKMLLLEVLGGSGGSGIVIIKTNQAIGGLAEGSLADSCYHNLTYIKKTLQKRV
jgi:hypothetical protein